MVKIGNVELAGRLFLAPMAGVTDASFRLLCRKHGAALATSEMISSKALMYQDGKTKTLLVRPEGDTPLAVQIFGSDPSCMAEAACKVIDLCRPEIIDINMGCPAPKITGNGEGSALMKEPLTAARVIEAVVKASDLPVSVKFRKGWDSGHVNCVDFARMAEASGAAFVTIHGRTRDQMYSGAADWEVIAEAKAVLSIPVIGNGDVTDGSSAIAMRDYTGCDGIMIARGALGNPYVFQEVKAAFAGVPYTPPSNAERLDLAIAHVRGLVAHKGPHGVIEMRKHIAYYVRGMKGASVFRTAATLAPTAEALIEMIEEYKSSLE